MLQLIQVIAGQLGGRGVAGCNIAAHAVGILKAHAEHGGRTGYTFYVICVHAGSAHFGHHLPPGRICAHFANGNNAEVAPWAGSQQPGHVMADDVQFAVIADVEQPAEAALLAPQCVIFIQGKENAAADSANADQTAIFKEIPAQVPLRFQNSSHSGFSLMGWRAVSSVAVMMASGCRCSSVMGYSGVGSLNSATRRAVCFQAPVSL